MSDKETIVLDNGVRKRGRPQTRETRAISRNAILKIALKLSRTTPLQDLSIVAVAKAMGVTPALIHYYLGGRDWLTSGVMNLFYKELLRKWPAETGDWKADLLSVSRVIYDHFVRYGGIAAYAISNNQFRYYQLVAFGDRDYGVELLERFAGCIRAAGLPTDRTGIYANQYFEFIISMGHSTSRHIIPEEQRQFLDEKISKLCEKKYPNIAFGGHIPGLVDGERTFEQGCCLLILGMSVELSGIPACDAAVLPTHLLASKLQMKPVAKGSKTAAARKRSKPVSA